MSVSVCVSFHYKSDLLLFLHVAYNSDSVFIWWHCGTLCTSGFMDNVIFAHNGPYGVVSILLRRVTSLHRRVQACCVVLVALCHGRRRAGAPRLDDHRARGVGGGVCNAPLKQAANSRG